MKKVIEINPYLLGTMAGGAADCLAISDMEVLTSEGFMGFEALKAAWEAGRFAVDLTVASYDEDKGKLTYEVPSQFFDHSEKLMPLVTISPKDDDDLWADDALARGDAGAAVANRHSNNISLRVTRGHDLYLRYGSFHTTSGFQPSRSSTFSKVNAGDLLALEDPAGVTALCLTGGLATDEFDDTFKSILESINIDPTNVEHVLIFLRVLGYFIGDGSMRSHRSTHTIRFAPVKTADQKFLRHALQTLGLTECAAGEASGGYTVGTISALGELPFHIADPAWVKVFDDEFGMKYGFDTRSTHNAGADAAVGADFDVGIKSVKWFPKWVFNLPPTAAKAVLDGLQLADGSDGGRIFTSGILFRDTVVQLALHAGLSPRFFRSDKAIVANHDNWTVQLSTRTPAAFAAEDVRLGAEPEGSYCFSMPSGFLVVRRVKKDATGNIIMASRPTIVGNCEYWERYVGKECRLYELKHNQRITVCAASKLLSNILYHFKGQGLSVGSMMAGYDHDGPALYYCDSDGERVKGDRFSVGSGSTYAYSVMDSEYRADMTVEEAVALGRRAIYHATHRDTMSGGFINVYHVGPEGWTRYDPVDCYEHHYGHKEPAVE